MHATLGVSKGSAHLQVTVVTVHTGKCLQQHALARACMRMLPRNQSAQSSCHTSPFFFKAQPIKSEPPPLVFYLLTTV